MKAVLSSSAAVAVLASEEDDTPIACGSAGAEGYVVVFDPLDGSRNIDAAIPTGGEATLLTGSSGSLLRA